MTRHEKREHLARRQTEIMREEGQRQMLVQYGDGWGDPGCCVTIEDGDGQVAVYWFHAPQTFSGWEEWLAEQHR